MAHAADVYDSGWVFEAGSRNRSLWSRLHVDWIGRNAGAVSAG